jgi:PAS domain S-box-containing protein
LAVLIRGSLILGASERLLVRDPYHFGFLIHDIYLSRIKQKSPMNWSYAYSPDIWPAFITLVMAIYLGWYGWRRRSIPAARPFSIACLLGAFWTLGVILQIAAVDSSIQVFWLKFQAIWQLPVVTAIFCFVLQFAGLGRWLVRRNYALLSLVPALSILAIVTNDFHHLVWTGFRMNGYIRASPGPLYWVIIVYILLVGVCNFVILVRLALRSPRHRWPVAIILSGQFLGRIVFALNSPDIVLIGPGEAIFLTVGVVSITYAFAFLRFHAIDPVASACTEALRQMQEGMLVLDSQGRILDMNPMAAAILGRQEAVMLGKSAAEIMPADSGIPGLLDNTGSGQTEMVLGKDGSSRQYSLNFSQLKGRDGEVIGQLLLMHDITDQKQAQDRLLEQQSVVATLQERERLARELHDGIGQIFGYIGLQAQTALKWVSDGNKEKAEPILERLAEVAKDAHADVRESILSLRADSGQGWSFIPTLRRYLDKYQAIYGIHTDLSLHESIGEDTFDPATGVQLLRVIQEALNNSRKHSDAHAFRVCIEMDGSNARIAIADDGLGFDPSLVERGDVNHFGLTFMRERMVQIGGSLKVESTPGEGTVLRLFVPLRKRGPKTR